MRWIVIVILALSAATCGQKGPLHLPEPQVESPLTVELI